MSILVIDPGYKNLGMTVFDMSGDLIVTDSLTFTKMHDWKHRVRIILAIVQRIIRTYAIDRVVFEDYVVIQGDAKSNKGQKTLGVVMLIAGICEIMGRSYEIWKHGDWNAVWKRFLFDRKLKGLPTPKRPTTDNEHIIDSWQQGIAWFVKEGILK